MANSVSKAHRYDCYNSRAASAAWQLIRSIGTDMNTSLIRLAATSAIAAACLSACGGGGGGGGGTTVASQTTSSPGAPTTPTSPTSPTSPPVAVQFGTAKVSLTGEPGCGYDAVNVTVSKVRFHMSATAAPTDAGWTDVTLATPRRIDLSQMGNGASVDLGTAALLPGHYAQALLVLDQNSANGTANSVVVSGTALEKPLLTQTAAPDGTSIALGSGFDIANGAAINVVADFDGCRSVLPRGADYLLRPVINAVPATKNGIDGFLDKSLLGTNVRVSAQQKGVEIRATQPDPTTGEFLLARLPVGSYDIVITADNRAAAAITGVNVADATAVVALNTAAASFFLAPGATGSIDALLTLVPYSPVVAPFGSATQTFINGPRISVRDRVADLGSGFVHIGSLPKTSPSLAVWQSGQPLSFIQHAPTNEAPAFYLVSTSAPGYSTSGELQIEAK